MDGELLTLRIAMCRSGVLWLQHPPPPSPSCLHASASLLTPCQSSSSERTSRVLHRGARRTRLQKVWPSEVQGCWNLRIFDHLCSVAIHCCRRSIIWVSHLFCHVNTHTNGLRGGPVLLSSSPAGPGRNSLQFNANYWSYHTKDFPQRVPHTEGTPRRPRSLGS